MEETRKDELLNCFNGIDENAMIIIRPMIDNIVFIENKLEELRQLPFVSVNPKNKMQQKPTTASRMFKELNQQYNNSIKILISVLMKNGEEEESPLRKFMSQMKENYK